MMIIILISKKKNKSQSNADSYLSSINIATETTHHAQPNDIVHVKKHYAVNLICGK